MPCRCLIVSKSVIAQEFIRCTHLDTGLSPWLVAMLSECISLPVSEFKTVVAFGVKNRSVVKKSKMKKSAEPTSPLQIETYRSFLMLHGIRVAW
jgi:hypothetical protein